MQKIFNRVKQIVLKPRETWEIIAGEEATLASLMKEYLLILAAVPALAAFLGRWIVGVRIPFAGVYRFSLGASLLNAILSYVFTIVGVWVLGKVTSLLAPNFGAEKNDDNGFKVAVYTYTPILAAGVLHLIPSLSPIVFLAGLYGLYLLYVGLPIVMKSPKEKTMGYTIVIIVALVLIYIILGSISAAILQSFGPDLPRIS